MVEIMKKNTLFIIGNGFDIYHGLPTSTSDFCDILYYKNIGGEIDSVLEIFMYYGIDWGEYENSLSLLDLDEIEEHKLTKPDYHSNYDGDKDGIIRKMRNYLDSLNSSIIESLSEMVKTANEKLFDEKARIKNVFKKKDAILSFNYTSTLEKLYGIEGIPILHIHGYFDNDEELLFGYKDGINADEYRERHFDPFDGNRDYCVDSQRENIAKFYESLRKEIQLYKLRNFLHNIQYIDHICVMGHSMSYVDSEYMELIEKTLHPSKWYISQYNNSPSYEELDFYSFANKIIFYSLSDLSDLSVV